MEEILDLANEKKILVIHSCSRSKLGNMIFFQNKNNFFSGLAFTGKLGPKISVLSVLNYENYESEFNSLKELVLNKRNEYQLRIKNAINNTN